MFAVTLTLSALSLMLKPFFFYVCIADAHIIFHMHSSAEQVLFSFCVFFSVKTLFILLRIMSLRINSMSLKTKQPDEIIVKKLFSPKLLTIDYRDVSLCMWLKPGTNTCCYCFSNTKPDAIHTHTNMKCLAKPNYFINSANISEFPLLIICCIHKCTFPFHIHSLPASFQQKLPSVNCLCHPLTSVNILFL